MRHGVVDVRMRIGMLAAVEPIKSVVKTLRAFRDEFHADVMARKRAAQVDVGDIVVAVAAEHGLGRADVKTFGIFFLHAVMRQTRIVFQKNFRHRIGKSYSVGDTDKVFDQYRVASLFAQDQHARKAYLARSRKKKQMDRRRNPRIPRNVQKNTLLKKPSI